MRKKSGYTTPDLIISRKDLIKFDLFVNSFYDDWCDYRDGFRDFIGDFKKINKKSKNFNKRFICPYESIKNCKMPIKQNIKKIKSEIPEYVALVAATKTRSIREIEEAVKAGIRIVGENYVQEAEQKYKVLKGKVKFHCIGHLQTNKVKKAVEIFDMVQTIESLKLAKEIDKKCKSINKIMPALIEINIGKEQNKTGISPEDTIKLIKEINNLENIKIKGLMIMAPYFDEQEKTRIYFKKTKELFDRIKVLNIRNVDMEILSMGMSNDFKIAIEEGSNMVRIGTKIFGKRD